MKRKVPRLRTDEEAEAFLDQDLSDLDFSQFRPAGFEFENKSERINMRVPKPLLDALKRRAKDRGIPYTRFIRELMEREISQPEKVVKAPKRERSRQTAQVGPVLSGGPGHLSFPLMKRARDLLWISHYLY